MIRPTLCGSARSAVVLFAAGLLILAGVDRAEAQEDWPLRCNLRTTGLSLQSGGFWLYFRGASAGFATRPPAKGECAWEDRGWREGEPSRLVWSADQDLISRVELDQENRANFLVMDSRASLEDRTTMANVFEAWKADGYIRVRVKRDGRNLIITRVVFTGNTPS
jgi:hypothetical protein